MFSRNVAVQTGGGLSQLNNCGGNVNATNTSFTGNSAASGGGLALTGATLSNVIVSANHATGLGGGIFGGAITTQGLFVVLNEADSNYGGADVSDFFPVGGYPFVISNNTPNDCLAGNGVCGSP